MNFFKKLFGIKSVNKSDELLTPVEYKRLEEYAKQLVEAELKKDEPISDKKSWIRIRDKKNVFKKKSTKIKIEDALYTIEEFHRYIECNAKSILSLLSQNEVDNMYKDWFKDSRRSFNDFIWSLFNRAKLANRINDIDYNKYGTIQNSEEAFYLRERDIYYDMARFRFMESENVKAKNQMVRLAIEAEINSYIYGGYNNKNNIVWEVYLHPHPRCLYSKSFDKRYSLDEFLDKCGIALDGCNCNTGCGCSIGIVAKRDENGRIIRKN